MTDLDWNDVLSNIQSHCESDAGKDWLQAQKAFEQADHALERQSQILSLMHALKGALFKLRLHGLDMVYTWLRRVEKNQILSPVELKDLRLFLEDISYILEQLEAKENFEEISYLLQISKELEDPKELLSYINLVISESGEIKSDASETLFKLFSEKKSLQKQVQSILNKIVKDNDLEGVLQDRFVTTREGRLVLPVISGMRHDFDGIIHDSSHSKQTVFMEPKEAVQLNNKIAEIENKIKSEIEHILKDLSDHIFSRFDSLKSSFQELQKLDGLCAISHFALKAELNEFEWSPAHDQVFLPDCKHPLLSLEDPEVVANTIELTTQNRLLILSGPNAGGKTVLLKSIGLACEMARWGWPVCTSSKASLPFFKSIFVSLGDEQSIEENLSSFGGHLKKLNQACELQGPDHLVLIDEICGATEAQEGAALARAFIEEYRSQGVYGIITSHLAPLRSHWDEGVINGSMQYDQKKSQPTFKFVMGLAGESLAIPTAKRYQVSEHIIKRALTYLSPEIQKKLSGLEEIDQTKQKLLDLQSDYKSKLQELKKEKHRFEQVRKKFENEREDFLEDNLNKYQKQIEEFIKYDELKSKFDNIKNLEKLKDSLPQIVKYSGKSTEKSSELSVEDFEKKCPPGTSVFVKSLKRQGVVQGKPNSKEEVPILSQSMRIQVKISDLVLSSKAQNFEATSSPTSEAKGSKTSFTKVESAETERRLDLRGKNVDEALDLLDDELDRALRHSLLRLKIVHGHGSQDRLKKSIRTFLSRNTFVKSWVSGKAHNESDGVTIAELLS